MNLKEVTLAEPTFNYFKKKGFKLYAEYSISFRPVDFIAYKKDKLIAIELKTSLNKKVIQQACSCKSSVDLVYIVVSTNPNKSSLKKCQKFGLGVISIKDEVNLLLEPSSEGYTNIKKKNQTIKHLSTMEESKDAGKPNLKGEGPAQSIENKVKKLRKKGKSWKEIYNTIPNHYSSYKSLQSSMSLLEERKYINSRRNSQKETFESFLISYLKLMHLWDDSKSFLFNKRVWLKLEGEYTVVFDRIKTLNSYKNYDYMSRYLKRRIDFYSSKKLIKDKQDMILKIKKEKYIDIDFAYNYEEVIDILMQENRIEMSYLPIDNGKLIKNKYFNSSYWLKKEYNNYLTVYIFKK